MENIPKTHFTLIGNDSEGIVFYTRCRSCTFAATRTRKSLSLFLLFPNDVISSLSAIKAPICVGAELIVHISVKNQTNIFVSILTTTISSLLNCQRVECHGVLQNTADRVRASVKRIHVGTILPDSQNGLPTHMVEAWFNILN